MKILMIAHNDPAGMMIAFANAINRYTDHIARVITLDTRYQHNYEYDIVLSKLEVDDYGEIVHLLRTADIIHFHMTMDENDSIGPLVVKDFIGKKPILHHHHGHPDFRSNPELFSKKYRKLGRRAIVSTPDLLKLLPDATWQPNLVPLYEADYIPRPDHLREQFQVRVVQAPTRKELKNTLEFTQTVEQLALKFSNMTYHVIQGMPYRECLKFKRNAHIVFDHLQGYFGISSLESLAHGVPTIAGLDDWNMNWIREFTGCDRLPWIIPRNISELETWLADLIANPSQRVETGAYSRVFMEKHWSEQQALRVLLETYQSF